MQPSAQLVKLSRLTRPSRANVTKLGYVDVATEIFNFWPEQVFTHTFFCLTGWSPAIRFIKNSLTHFRFTQVEYMQINLSHQNCTFYPSKIQVKSITSHLQRGAFLPVLIHAVLRMRFGGRSSHNAGTTPLLTPPLCLVPPTNDDELSRGAANKMRPLIHVPNGLKLCTSILQSIWVVNLALHYCSFKFCQMMAEFTQGNKQERESCWFSPTGANNTRTFNILYWTGRKLRTRFLQSSRVVSHTLRHCCFKFCKMVLEFIQMTSNLLQAHRIHILGWVWDAQLDFILL